MCRDDCGDLLKVSVTCSLQPTNKHKRRVAAEGCGLWLCWKSWNRGAIYPFA